MMVKPKGYQDGDDFVPNVVLDSEGNDMIVKAARVVGSCSTCNETGTQEIGFQATVVGMLEEGATPHEEPGMSGTPPTLRVTQVLPYSSACPESSGSSTPSNDSNHSGNGTTSDDSSKSGSMSRPLQVVTLATLISVSIAIVF
jgi:hypothetical protein